MIKNFYKFVNEEYHHCNCNESCDCGDNCNCGEECSCCCSTEKSEDEVMDDVADDVMLSEYDSETPSGYQSRFESKKWIADAIKNKGSLRRKLHKKAGEKITNAEIDAELSELRDKDKDPNKPGLQLSKRDAAKRKQLVLAKTLKGLKK